MSDQNGTITATLEDGSTRTVASQSRVSDLLDKTLNGNGLHYLGALVNNDVVSLSYPMEVDCDVKFLTIADAHGWRIYRRSVSFLLAKTVKELFPEARFAVEHSLGSGFFCSFELNGTGGISDEQLEAIDRRMRESVAEDIPIERRKVAFTDAVRRFEEAKQFDKYNLLRFRNPPKIVIYSSDGFTDLAHGPLADSTGALGHFKLLRHTPGFVIVFPEKENPTVMAPFEDQPHLFQIFKEHKDWGRILRVRTVGDLNEINANHGMQDFIRIAEALHEKKIAMIADRIAQAGTIRWVLIAGPSSAGKTTFAKRLAVHMRVNGLRPVTISTDDYFVDRENTLTVEHVYLVFEHLETIDLPLFNDHLARLDAGEEVDVPRFNFAAGKREYKDKRLRIGQDELVILEGIHALNPRLTESLPGTHKFGVYISALTQLNLDFNNRMSTTDNRLLRRMVRDNTYRGNSGLDTIKMWPSVRRGEKRWVFPNQQHANIAFNSALDYELAVLKPFAEPVLAEIKPHHEQYGEARRLLDFLDSFLVAPAELVPDTSLLREFIGKSSFKY